MINRRKFNRLAWIWTAVVIFVCAWLIFTVVSNTVTSNNYNSLQRKAQHRAQFYRVVAGFAQSGEVTTADSLAMDLQKIPASKLRVFQGDSNRYGGVSDYLGIDPFTNECGPECGHLTPQFQSNLRQVKEGDLSRVISADQPAKPDHRSFSIPLAALFFLLTSPLAYRGWLVYQQRQREQSIESQYPDEYRLLSKLEQTRQALPPDDRRAAEINQLEHRLRGALKLRLGSGEAEVVDARIEQLVQEARESLNAIEEGNRVL